LFFPTGFAYCFLRFNILLFSSTSAREFVQSAQISSLYHSISPNVTVLRPDYYTQPSHYLKRLVQLYSGGQNIRRWFACFWLSDTVSNHFRSMSSILHRSFSIHF